MTSFYSAHDTEGKESLVGWIGAGIVWQAIVAGLTAALIAWLARVGGC